MLFCPMWPWCRYRCPRLHSRNIVDFSAILIIYLFVYLSLAFFCLLSVSYCSPFWLLVTPSLSSAYLMVLTTLPPTDMPVSALSLFCHTIKRTFLPNTSAYWACTEEAISCCHIIMLPDHDTNSKSISYPSSPLWYLINLHYLYPIKCLFSFHYSHNIQKLSLYPNSFHTAPVVLQLRPLYNVSSKTVLV